MKGIKVTIIKDKCTGCGTCMSIADEVFKYDDNGKSEVINMGEVITDLDIIEKVRLAVEMCADNAIVIEEVNDEK